MSISQIKTKFNSYQNFFCHQINQNIILNDIHNQICTQIGQVFGVFAYNRIMA